jgi:hypothetical protein
VSRRRALAVASLIAAGAVIASGQPAASQPQPKTQRFQSAPGLHPPRVVLSGTDPDPDAGDLFVDAQKSIQAGPMIVDPAGNLVWFKAMRSSAAFNVEVQSYKGQSVLTYWQGQVVPPGVGNGVGVILNHSYQQTATVRAGHGYHADLHEFQITPQGTALISAYAKANADLSSAGGPRSGSVLDSIIQEINIATGHVVWEWHAYRHVPVNSSYIGLGLPYDFFHVNSIQPLPGGKLLVSARHTCAVYEIDKRTGNVVWTLGGKHSSFTMGRGTRFCFQHDAHMQPDHTVTVFDNAAGPAPATEHESRALRIRFNFKTKRATLVQAYTNTPSVLSPSEGSVQVLSDANTFVGWGGVPWFSEFATSGKQLFSMRFPAPLQSYRAYRFPWWGQPATPPQAAVSSSPSGSTVYASWNGATTVASWQVFAGPSPGLLVPVGQFPRTSFETAMPVTSSGPYFSVRALGSNGQVLGTSLTVPAG